MYRSKATALISLSFLVIALGNSACEPTVPFNCDAIDETVLRTFPTTDTDPVTIRKWINTNYTTATKSLKEGTDVVGQTWFYWSLDQRDYGAAVSKAGAGLNVDWKGRKPSLKEVVSCLGKPEFYEARIFPPTDVGSLTKIGIWYPVRKLYISSTQSGSRLTFNDNTVFDRISVPEADSVRLMKLKPWPVNLDDLKLDH